MALRDPAQAALLKKKKTNKYRAQRTVVCGFTFDSRAEAARWIQLQSMIGVKTISRQKRYELPGGVVYVADFEIVLNVIPRRKIVEDVTGVMTPVKRVKLKLMKKFKRIDVQIVKMDSKQVDLILAAYAGAERDEKAGN